MRALFATAAGLALAACTAPADREPELPDTALTQVPSDPVATPLPQQVDSAIRVPATGAPAPAQRAPAVPRPRPTGAQPPAEVIPPPRDTRPSIPHAHDTLS